MSDSLNFDPMSAFRLDGKRALVTGAGRGIGLAIAQSLAAVGAHVTLAARTKTEIQDEASKIKSLGLNADAVSLDITDLGATKEFLESCDPFDVLVNNAGTNRPGPYVEMSVEDFDTVFDLNVRALFFASQAFAKRLIAEKKPGSIVNVSSQMGHVGAVNRTIYCASKHAVEGLTKALGVELAPDNIRVNSICPTFIETPLTKPYLKDEAFRDSVLNKIKLGRIGRVEDVIGGVLYLASDAASLVTGSSLKIDGGWTAD